MLQVDRLIRIVLADDHPVVREGLRTMLPQCGPVEIIGEAENGRVLIDLVEELQPDVVLMDIKMPEMNGIEAMELLTRNYPHVKVLVLSMYDNPEYVRRLVKAGCRGYMLKDSSPHEMTSAVEKIHRGEFYFSSILIPALVKADIFLLNNPDQELTAREVEVLVHLVNGLTNKRIGEVLQMTTRTAEKHREHIMKKTGCTTVAQLVRFAMDKGYVKMD